MDDFVTLFENRESMHLRKYLSFQGVNIRELKEYLRKAAEVRI